MSFRERDPFRVGFITGLHPLELVEDVNEEGKGLVHIFDPSVAELPSMDSFDLETLVKAKVPLEATNTKLFSGDAFLVADAFAEFENDDKE